MLIHLDFNTLFQIIIRLTAFCKCSYFIENFNLGNRVTLYMFQVSTLAFEFGEISKISKQAAQEGKLGKKLEWKIRYMVF